MKRLLRRIMMLALAVTIAVGATIIESTDPRTKSQALDNYENYESFTADYYLEQTASDTSVLNVSEEITNIFSDTSQHHGITRTIPRTNQGGKNLTILNRTAMQLQTAHNGQAEEPYDVSIEGDDVIIRLGDPDYYVRGLHSYQLDYQFQNVITEFSNQSTAWQELYWNTNGVAWQNGFKELVARVHFGDAEIAESYNGQNWCYVGQYGANDQTACTVTPIADGLEFRTTNLAPGENLTFVLQFAPYTFAIPEPTYDYRLPIILAVEILAAIIFAIFELRLWRQATPKRKYFRSLFIKPEYTPPAGFTVAEMTMNYLSSWQLGSSAVATILELAVTHKIALIEQSATSARKKAKPTWQIKILSLDLTKAQDTTLRLLAGKNQQLAVGQIINVQKHTATKSLLALGQKLNRQVAAALKRKHLLTKDCKNCGRLMFFGILWFILNFAAVPLLIEDAKNSFVILFGGTPFIIAITVIVAITSLSAIVVPTFCRRYLSHTKTGLELSRYLDGLKLYIEMAEADRLKVLQSVQGAELDHQGVVKLYEKLLPYAVIFNQERSWLKELEKYYQFDDTENPAWCYTSSGAFSGNFAFAVLAFNRQAQSYTNSVGGTSSGGSSSISGSSGGGFSGGGGGGGGGGSW